MRKRRPGSHGVSGPVIAALIVGCCVGALADWQLREKGPPLPVQPTEPAIARESAAARPQPSLSSPPPPESNGSNGSSPGLPAVDELARRGLRLPIDSMDPEPLKGDFDQRRGGGTRGHEAVDILAPRNTPVHAVEGGTIAKLFFSKAGGTTIYQFDPAGASATTTRTSNDTPRACGRARPSREETSSAMSARRAMRRPNTPHLHFAIFQLTSARHWWEGKAVDPYPVFQRAAP